MQLYHEATLCNLLEVLLYHASICEVGGDAMLELGDYCVRKVNLLNAGSVSAPASMQAPVALRCGWIWKGV